MNRKLVGDRRKAVRGMKRQRAAASTETEGGDAPDHPLHLVLHVTRGVVNRVTGCGHVLACTLDGIACRQRNRGKRRKAEYEFFEHESSFGL
jgi:hypothetical protein